MRRILLARSSGDARRSAPPLFNPWRHGAVRSFVVLAISGMLLADNALAKVTRIEILSRRPFADGMEFGDTGAYEVIRGRLHYAVDPALWQNAQIVDLHLATAGRLRADESTIEDGRQLERLAGDPRDDSGRVVFAGDFVLLKPVDLARGNHRLLYDVNNRGNLYALGYFNNADSTNDPILPSHAGNGWLMRQGYSILWSAWNWDVESVDRDPVRINLPIVVDEQGEPLTQRIHAELAVQSRDGVRFERIAWGGSRCYPAAAGYEQEAELTVRDLPDHDHRQPRETIPREQWDFARIDNGGPVEDPYHVFLPSGFQPGRLYELTYVASRPRVVGLGLAAIRDAISFFHWEPQDELGTSNPLTIDGRPDPAFAYVFGISQSGRVIVHMIYQGFHVDEAGRMVFEGAWPHVAGGGKGGFNYRFAQTTHHPKHLEGNSFPADHFPFNYLPDGRMQVDPLGQPGRQRGDVLAVAKQIGLIPRILVSNHEGEYWTRSASLVHTDVTGSMDVDPHPNVRMYLVNGARHGHPGRGSSRFVPTSEHALNHLDQRPIGRALLVALDQWVTHGVLPPESRVPRIDRDELISADTHRRRFPAIPAIRIGSSQFPAVRHPGKNLCPPRVDYGPLWWTEGIQTNVPPLFFGPPYVTLVPGIDEDGNPVGGIRLPEINVPLATYQAFNPRHARTGASEFLKPFDSSFWPLALTRQQRETLGDPRLSIEERYTGRDDYVQRYVAATEALVRDRLLLSEDADAMIDVAGRLHWPPEAIDRWPFWRLVE